MVQPLVGSQSVELRAEHIERFLLRGTGSSDWFYSLPLESTMHALMRAVLLWPPWMNALVLNTGARSACRSLPVGSAHRADTGIRRREPASVRLYHP